MLKNSTLKLLSELEDLEQDLLPEYNHILDEYNKISVKHHQHLESQKSGEKISFSIKHAEIIILKKMQSICFQYNKILKKIINHVSAHENKSFQKSLTFLEIKKEHQMHKAMLEKIAEIKSGLSMSGKQTNSRSAFHIFLETVQEKQAQLLLDYQKNISDYDQIIDQYNEYIKIISEDKTTSTVYPLTEDQMQTLETMRSICHEYIDIFRKFSEISSSVEKDNAMVKQITDNHTESLKILETIEKCIYNWEDLSLDEDFLPQFTTVNLEVKASSVPNAGKGLFVSSDQSIKKNQIIGTYPGIPVPENSLLYNKKSHFLFGFQFGEDSAENGIMIDADPKVLDKISHDLEINPPLGSNTKVHIANMAVNSKNALAYFRPIFIPSQMPCSSIPFGNAKPHLLPTVVAIAKTDISAGQEILMDYGRDSREKFKKRCGLKH
jgi:hypothetical protein